MTRKTQPVAMPHPCCGECTFCNAFPNKTDVRCWHNKPQYVGTGEDEDQYARGGRVDVREPACADFKPRQVN